MSSKRDKPPRLCPICGEPADRELVPIRISMAVGEADYKFDFKSEMKACTVCRDKLSWHIRLWYEEANKTNFYNKFA